MSLNWRSSDVSPETDLRPDLLLKAMRLKSCMSYMVLFTFSNIAVSKNPHIQQQHYTPRVTGAPSRALFVWRTVCAKARNQPWRNPSPQTDAWLHVNKEKKTVNNCKLWHITCHLRHFKNVQVIGQIFNKKICIQTAKMLHIKYIHFVFVFCQFSL